jgi:hypothetical protein
MNQLLLQNFSEMYDHLHHSVSDSSVLYYESDGELTSYVLLSQNHGFSHENVMHINIVR